MSIPATGPVNSYPFRGTGPRQDCTGEHDPPPCGIDQDFTILSFARFRCAIRDLALVVIWSAAASASLIVRSILSGAIPRRIRLSITFFLRSDLTAFLICLASANMSFGIFVIPLHYRVSIHGANLIGALVADRNFLDCCCVYFFKFWEFDRYAGLKSPTPSFTPKGGSIWTVNRRALRRR